MGGITAAARLIDGTAIRSMLWARRGESRDFRPPDDPDPAVLELTESPFESVPDVTRRLRRLEARLRARGDRRAVFLTIYVRMTEHVSTGIDAGRFADPVWMRRYLVTFADYYRRAFHEFERGRLDELPQPWHLAFGAATAGETLVMQDAFLGVNAHINYDLALALTDVGIDPDRAAKYRDHRAINDILARIVDLQQAALADLYAARLDDVDTALGRLDESITLGTMTYGREQAWRLAVVLTDVHVPPVPAAVRWVLRTTATGGANFILGPGLDPSLRATLRRVEFDGLSLDTVLEAVD